MQLMRSDGKEYYAGSAIFLALIANRFPRIMVCSMVVTAITLQFLFADIAYSVPLLDVP